MPFLRVFVIIGFFDSSPSYYRIYSKIIINFNRTTKIMLSECIGRYSNSELILELLLTGADGSDRWEKGMGLYSRHANT